MVLELYKYECQNNEYLIYDSNKNEFEFGGREARVMCSLEVGLMTKKFLVIPPVQNQMTVKMYNPDGTQAQPQLEDMKVFARYLEDAGYERTPRSNCGRISDEEVKKVSKMAFFDNFILKYNLKKAQ